MNGSDFVEHIEGCEQCQAFEESQLPGWEDRQIECWHDTLADQGDRLLDEWKDRGL